MGLITRLQHAQTLNDILERPPVAVGVDIGQTTDPAAICVSECIAKHTGKFRQVKRTPAYIDKRGQFIPARDAEPIYKTNYYIRHITRLPLGMKYPKVAEHIADLLCNPIFNGRVVSCYLDITGVGRPVYDELCEVARLNEASRRIALLPTTFVYGDYYNTKKGILGKAFLVSRLQALLQWERVHGPDTPEMQATIEELKVYQIKVDQDGKDTYGAKTGAHDDLATALGLSCLHDPLGLVAHNSGRIF